MPLTREASEMFAFDLAYFFAKEVFHDADHAPEVKNCL